MNQGGPRSTMTPDELDAWTRGGGDPWRGRPRRKDEAPSYLSQLEAKAQREAARAAREQARRALAVAQLDLTPEPLAPAPSLAKPTANMRQVFAAPAPDLDPIPTRVRPRPTMPHVARGSDRPPGRVEQHLVQRTDDPALARLEDEVTPHGTIERWLAGCRCLDCANRANEAAMLGELPR